MLELKLTPKIVLLGAANLLRERDWTVGTLEHLDGRMCVAGAIERFVNDYQIPDPVVADNLKFDAMTQLTRTIWEDPTGAAHPHPTAWNDRHCGSRENAIAMLERAALGSDRP